MWFEKVVQSIFEDIIYSIDKISNKEIKDYFNFNFISLVRHYSNADDEIYPPVRKKNKIVTNENISNNSIIKHFTDNLLSTFEIFKNHYSIYFKNNNLHKVDLYLQSASEVNNEISDVDLIITSPPYIAAQKYLRTTKFELFWLNMLKSDDLPKLDREFIGHERVYAKDRENLKSLDGDKPWHVVVDYIKDKNIDRAAIMNIYFEGMENTIKNMYHYLGKEGRFVFVIGNNSVTNHRIRNDVIFKEIFLDIGYSFIPELSMKDKIKIRRHTTKRNNTADSIHYENILVFEK